jgi:DNA repair exonuclease SbcCD ATPase subunit
MSFQIPSKVKACKQTFEEKLFKKNGELVKPREVLLEKIKNEKAEISEIEEQLAAHIELLGPVTQTYDLFKSFIEHVKKELNEGLEQAKADDNVKNFKSGDWCVQRQDALDDLRSDADIMQEIKTELEYYVQDLTSKIKRATPKKKKESAQKQTQKQTEPGQTATAQSTEPTIKESKWSPEETVNHHNTSPVQHEVRQSVEPQYFPNKVPEAQYVQSPMYTSQSETQSTSSSASDFEDQLRRRDREIIELNEKIATLRTEKADYKQKYKAQKKLTKKAEDEVERLKEQSKRSDEPNKDQQQLRDRMEANHQELLNSVRQGFSNVTIEILRSNQR